MVVLHLTSAPLERVSRLSCYTGDISNEDVSDGLRYITPQAYPRTFSLFKVWNLSEAFALVQCGSKVAMVVINVTNVVTTPRTNG
ncbi:hypothetical protein EVAR_48528_1 [Eumeta japonica]|uniref:Uncharacterized protein n=1 Tax=Eumeta variegata TaxID=151549 RepID=A0A4C1YCG3_EUMVA|nr:hypothetical protein EVAR_48528_1 [Eumeta japonica]